MLETHYFGILVGPKGFVEVSLSCQLMGDHILPLDPWDKLRAESPAGQGKDLDLKKPLCTYLPPQATGCFVDQTKIESEEDAPVTAYYLWLPYLLTICFILARLPR